VKRQQAFIAALFCALLLLAACANIGTPDGGPYDETPPRVVGSSPHFGTTLSTHQKIVIEFDENIKLEGANEKVVISPPQVNQPEISANAKKIEITLLDTLQPATTYTIDFADAIQDNNEGNPMGDYAFTFSTGAELDTFQVSGHVLNAENLEPIKGMLVGLYAADTLAAGAAEGGDAAAGVPDSLFRTRPFERISRTDSRGHFVVKGLSPHKRYRVFALQDQDQNFLFSQKSEMIAFNNALVRSTSRPDVRPDTIWHDSIYYDSIIYTPYTHYYPDNITLLAFNEAGQNRALLKTERNELRKFSIFFTAPDSLLPVVKGLNFDERNLFVVERNARRDTLTYWLRDSLVYNQDTLELTLTYRATDTLSQLVDTTDTLTLVSRQTYERTLKKRAEAWEEYAKEYIKDYRQQLKAQEYEDQQEADATDDDEAKRRRKEQRERNRRLKDSEIPIPPMPEPLLEVRTSRTTLNPDNNYDITFSTPIDTAYVDLIHFSEKVDSVSEPRPFRLIRQPGTVNAFRLYAEWLPGSSYELRIDTGAFVSMYGERSDAVVRSLKVRPLEEFSTLFVQLQPAPANAIIQLLDPSGRTVKEQPAPDGQAAFYFIMPGTYYLSLLVDTDGDGRWSPGDYDLQRQPEDVYFYPGAINLKADWEITQNWNPTARPRAEQKPARITKQKPDRERIIKNRNAERERQKNRRDRRRNGSNADNTYGGGTIYTP